MTILRFLTVNPTRWLEFNIFFQLPVSSIQEQRYVHASQRLERETSEERGDVLSKPYRGSNPAMGGREAGSLWRLPLLMVLQVRFFISLDFVDKIN